MFSSPVSVVLFSTFFHTADCYVLMNRPCTECIVKTQTACTFSGIGFNTKLIKVKQSIAACVLIN